MVSGPPRHPRHPPALSRPSRPFFLFHLGSARLSWRWLTLAGQHTDFSIFALNRACAPLFSSCGPRSPALKEFGGGQDLISQLLSDLGEGPVTSGKENNTGAPAPGQFGRDLVPFFDDGSGGGAKPLAEVPVEETGNAGLKKKKRGGKKGKGGPEDQQANGGNATASANASDGKAQAQGQKEKEKGKKKSGDGGGSGGQQDGRRGSMWAGSSFQNSPAPEDVPLPSAGLIAKVLAEAQKASAEQRTSELQRMLHLNVSGEEPLGAAANDDAASSDLRRMLNIAA